MPHVTDLDLTFRDVAELASTDCVAAFSTRLGYDTARRTTLSPEAIGLPGETANAIKRIETLSEYMLHRSTRPIRDPIDVLEAKIGSMDPAVEKEQAA